MSITWQTLGKDAGAVVKTLAPTVATALGGPLAGTAVAALVAQFGGDPAKAAQEIAAADPATLVKLRELDMNFKAKMAELGVQEEQLGYADQQSARAMEVATKANTPAQLAWLVISGFMLISMGVIVACFAWPDRAKALLTGEAGLFFGTIFGYLMNEAKQAGAFYFGSTAGSQAKDVTLAEIAKS